MHKLTSSQVTDDGKSRIPVLTYRSGNTENKAAMNEKKGKALAGSFFPLKPPHLVEPQGEMADTEPCCKADHITKEQIKKQLQKIKPYKAPGPDGIPNIVLTKCTDLLLDRLSHIYTVMYENKLHYEPWKYFTTVVLCKPGKPCYDIPKAYRPITLLNTM